MKRRKNRQHNGTRPYGVAEAAVLRHAVARPGLRAGTVRVGSEREIRKRGVRSQ